MTTRNENAIRNLSTATLNRILEDENVSDEKREFAESVLSERDYKGSFDSTFSEFTRGDVRERLTRFHPSY